jgi:MoaA/NifB/PqqE/SkfB family radical SAM enzyme
MSLIGTMAKDARFALGLVKQTPFDCMIQVTNRCNLTCTFCEFWNNPAPKREELTLAEMEDIAAQLDEMGCFIVSIEGGEPLVRSDIVDIVRIFSRRHITALFTSGWFITPELARALWDANLTHASVSIDFADAARHDAKRGQPGTAERAWRAVDILRDTAPRGGKQVNVMTVLMDANWQEIEPLLQQTAARGIGHQFTMLSSAGVRRGNHGGDDAAPPIGISAHMTQLWEKYRHIRYFRDYFGKMDAYLSGDPMPTCRAGTQSLNIDHVGNVATCIERIDRPVGNIRKERLAALHEKLRAQSAEVAACQDCWTACRGLAQAMGGGGSINSWLDLARRTSTY